MLAIEGDSGQDKSEWEWKMRPEVADAIALLGLCDQSARCSVTKIRPGKSEIAVVAFLQVSKICSPFRNCNLVAFSVVPLCQPDAECKGICI
jgi:hypothetical protein